MFAGKKSAQIREILISESAWEEMTCLFAPSLTLSLDEQQSIPLSTVSGTQGYPGMDIRPLASAGICSFDPGFANTAGCTSAIS